MDVNDNEELNAIREGVRALCAEFPANAAPISTNLILSYVAEHSLEPRSF